MVDGRTGSAPESADLRFVRFRSDVSWTLRTQLRYPKSGDTVKVAFTFVSSSSHWRGLRRSGGRSQSGVAVSGGVKAQPIRPMS